MKYIYYAGILSEEINLKIENKSILSPIFFHIEKDTINKRLNVLYKGA